MKIQMEHDWYLVPNEKLIVRKRIPLMSTLVVWLGFRRIKAVNLYSMIVRTYALKENIQGYKFPIDHDNFPKPDQYPFYYKLMNGWSIEQRSVCFIKEGPIFSEDANKVIVHSKVFVQSFLQLAWKVISIFGIFLGITTSLLKLSGVI
jgi:hypothetical protein